MIKLDKLIKPSQLTKEFGLSRSAIGYNHIPKKYHNKVKELNDLINYWRSRNE